MEPKTTQGIYSLIDLQKACSSGCRFTFIFFKSFGINNPESNQLTEDCFSQFFPCQFADINGEQYSSCVQYMISQKALLCKDQNSYNQIMQTQNQDLMMKISHEIKNFNQKIWDEKSEDIVFQGNLYKFSQNQKLKDFLLSFPLNSIFIDAYSGETNWGIGPKSNPCNPFQWEGKNKLGFQITKVRDHLLSLITTKIKPIETTPIVYNLHDLQNSIKQGNRYVYVHFNEKNGLSGQKVTESCFSQFYQSQFCDDEDRQYSDCVQYMMSSKAELFGDSDSFNKIMKCKNPYEMREIGRKIKNFDAKIWDENSEEVVFKGNLCKFSQNEKLLRFLLSFPLNAIFVEADPTDSIWGIRLGPSDQGASDPFKWKGYNKLGFQINRVRDTLLDLVKQVKEEGGGEDNDGNRERNASEERCESESENKNKFVENENLTSNEEKEKLVVEGFGVCDEQTFVSHAYDDHVNNICYSEKVESIDLLSSGLPFLNLMNYPNLRQIRISKCIYLKSVRLSGMPNLRVVDLLDNQSLCDVSFSNCPKLTALEVGFCSKLTQISGLETIEYFSAPNCTSLGKINLNKKIVFLDVTGIPLQDISDVIKNYQYLECLACSKVKTLKLSDITSNKSLKIIQLESTKIYCDKINPKTSLKIIIFDNQGPLSNYVEGNVDLLRYFYVTTQDQTNKDINNFSMFDDFSPKYQKYQKLFYGPWGIPKVDLTPSISIKAPIISPTRKINQAKAADSILGSIIGSAIFDMMGVGVEFIPDKIAKALLLGEMNIAWSHPRCNSNNRRFVRGTPTDDTSQSILILRSIVDVNTNPSKSKSKSLFAVHGVKIDPQDFALKLIDWVANGHKEHKHYGALDVGISTYKISKNPLFKVDPTRASEQEWINGGKRNAANGSVMRIASSGCFAFWDEEVVVAIAESYSRVTHFDPRCVFTAIAAALLISRYIQFNCGFINELPGINDTLEVAYNMVPGIEPHLQIIKKYINCKTVEELELSAKNEIGFCLKAFGAGIWSLKHCDSIEEGLQKVIREGGDADTNAAVVGALLGAKFGYSKIPNELKKYMFVGQWMFREIEPYMKLMGIQMPASPYLK